MVKFVIMKLTYTIKISVCLEWFKSVDVDVNQFVAFYNK